MNRLRCSALVLGASVALMCGCGGGGTVFNPTPVPSTLFPSGATVGSQSLVVLISGTNFQSNSTTQWNGVDRPSVFNDATSQIAMTLLDGDLANPGNGQITVTNPTPGGGISTSAVTFLVNPSALNGPLITSVSPSSAVAGSKNSVTLTLNGNNFVSTDQIAFSGTPLTTTVSGASLMATISSEDVATVGLAGISVQTNVPGVASPSVKFPIGPSSNPSPTLASITPSSAKIGVLPPGGYLLLKGANFVPGSTVLFNGNARPTGYSSATQLAVGVLPADVAAGGTIAITVSNPNPGGGNSAAVNFSVQ